MFPVATEVKVLKQCDFAHPVCSCGIEQFSITVLSTVMEKSYVSAPSVSLAKRAVKGPNRTGGDFETQRGERKRVYYVYTAYWKD